jgi:hypothetical protein
MKILKFLRELENWRWRRARRGSGDAIVDEGDDAASP